MSQWSTPVCCNKPGVSPGASASLLMLQLSFCMQLEHNHDDRYTCYHDGSFDGGCYSIVRRIVRQLVEQYPDDADREASRLQGFADEQWHDVRHTAQGAKLNHSSRICAKRAGRIVKWLVQAGAVQPEAQQQYRDWCHKCRLERSNASD